MELNANPFLADLIWLDFFMYQWIFFMCNWFSFTTCLKNVSFVKIRSISQVFCGSNVPEVPIFCVILVLSLFTGVKNVEVDLSNQVVRILGSTPVKTMTEALEQTGRKARLIGQGVPEGSPVNSLLFNVAGCRFFNTSFVWLLLYIILFVIESI